MCAPSDVSLTNADTDHSPYDTGTFASTGTVVAGKATHITAEAMRDDILDFAVRHTGTDRDQCRLDNDAVICGNKRILLKELHAEGAKVNHRFTVGRRAYLSPRSIAFNVQGVRLAVHKVTGEVRILHSVHAADIGRPINPMQCRGQLDGAVAMGYGWALVENMVHDEGHMVNPQLRNCRVPAFADTPHTDIFFADTVDTIGPLGAKSQGECAINPVAPAVSNALANATGVRFAHLPFTPDRLFADLAARSGAARVMSVTIVTQTAVKPDSTEAFARWQSATSTIITSFPGFIEQRLLPPNPPVQVDWVILQRFAAIEDAQRWLGSDERAKRLKGVTPMLVGRDDVHIVRDDDEGRKPSPVSAVISTRVKPGREAEYIAWERKIAAVQANARGLQGYRFEPPMPGVQDDYVAILRFDSEANMQAWLDSPERQRLVEEAAPFTEEFHARLTRTGFEQWFRDDAGAAAGPLPVWKMDMVVLLLLYPIVFLWGVWVGTPLIAKKLHLPFAVNLFIGNIFSVGLTGFLVPWTANRPLAWWLRPKNPKQAMGVHLLGAAIVCAIYAACIWAFWKLF